MLSMLEQNRQEDKLKITLWQKKKGVMYIGGDPSKNEPPIITVELESPQIQLDTDKNIIIVIETK